jgi:hypothetical protein
MAEQIKWIRISPEVVDYYGFNLDFERMPREVAASVSDGVSSLARVPAGGRIRFCTDSDLISIRAMISASREIGFDLYEIVNGCEICRAGFRRPESFICDGSFEATLNVGAAGKMRSFTLNFPYNGRVGSFELGINAGASLARGDAYVNRLPVVFYGSSITQGAWATRPGMTYEAMISQRYNLNYMNLGFAGKARGEREIAEYMASLEMCAFVCDYDHNSYTEEHHEKTHLPLYKTIRAKHPDIPYIIITRPDYASNPTQNQRLADIIHKTYDYALANGDRNVYYIEGKTIFAGDYYHNCTKDGCHPNDLGFYRMATVIGPVVAASLGIESHLHDMGI